MSSIQSTFEGDGIDIDTAGGAVSVHTVLICGRCGLSPLVGFHQC